MHFIFTADQLSHIIYQFWVYEEAGIFSKEKKSFKFICEDREQTLYYCARLANLFNHKVTFDFFSGLVKVSFYDSEYNEPKIDLIDLIQAHFNKPNFWKKFNIDEKYNYITVNTKNVVEVFHKRPFIGDDGMWDYPNLGKDFVPTLYLTSKQDAEILDYLKFFEKTLKVIQRP